MLGDAGGDFHALLFCFRFQDLSLVCLPDIAELANDVHRAPGDANQIAFNRESLLGREHMEVGNAHIILHPITRLSALSPPFLSLSCNTFAVKLHATPTTY